MITQNGESNNATNPVSGSEPTLRQRAEGKVRAMGTEDLAALSSEDTSRLLYELRVHQLELETQNEELRRVQEALEASRSRYFDLYDLAPVGYFTVSEQGLIVEANLTAASLLGVARGALVKQPLTRFVLPQDQDIYYRHRKQLWETGQPQVCELRMVRHAQRGSPFWARLQATADQDAGCGEPRVACRVAMSDITAHKRVEEALHESEAKLQVLFEQLPIGVSLLDQERKVIYANPALAKILNLAREDLFQGKHRGRRYIRADGTPMPPEEYASARAFREQQPVRDVVTGVITESGRTIWTSVSAAPFPFIDKGVVIATADISAHKQAEQLIEAQNAQLDAQNQELTAQQKELLQSQAALLESEARYHELFESINSGVAVYEVRDDGRSFILKEFNRAGERIDHDQRERLIGKSIYEVRPGIEQFGLVEVLRKVWQTGEPASHPVTLYQDERLAGWYENYIYRLSSGEVVAVFEDVTERKRMAEDLQAYSERLEEMVEERTRELAEVHEQLVRREKLTVLGQLAGTVGHELRNPLGTISNAVYYLNILRAQGAPSEQIDEMLDLISGEVQRANRILSNLVDFARTRPASRQQTMVSSLVRESLRRCALPENVRVSTRVPDDLPPVWVDAEQIEQVLINLVTNACQAMPDGGDLTLAAMTLGEAVALSVTDTGCGISKQHIGRLFEPLFTTRPSGLGLGLTTCKNLVEANEGQIWVESQEGVGTTFTVVLPTSP